ncbi:MAG: MG2 domain-containing protein [Bacteroidetes bacterium]|nr:MG2 domain-containing protein [Bacteroidota bacterium]
MKKKTFFFLTAMVLVVVVILITISCSRKKHVIRVVNPAFKEYVQAFTSGVVSTHSTIRIRLVNEMADTGLVNVPVDGKLFSFKPSVKGAAYWIDSRTLEFRPSEYLKPGEFYNAEFNLSKLLKVPDSLKTMEFQFQVMQQDCEVKVENHKAYNGSDLGKEKLYGAIITADFANDSAIEKVLTATQNGNRLSIAWNHEGKNRNHYFRVDSVKRGENKSIVTLEWNGKFIDAERIGKLDIEIPALGDFRFLDARVVQANEQYIIAQFSDPLLEDQALAGVVRIGRVHEFRYKIEDNELQIYPPELNAKKVIMNIESFLKNNKGKTLGMNVRKDLVFGNTKPNIRFLGDGVIMPGSGGFLLPVEAVNLKAMDIKVTKIYQSNVMQFLQVNDLNGQSELARVGKVVLKKTVPLGGVLDYGTWNRYSIDMSTLIRSEPGAIYSVQLSFKKKYSTFPCEGTDGNQISDQILSSWIEIREPNPGEYEYYNDYYEDYYDDEGNYSYNWQDRDDPCKNTYYRDKRVSRNVFSSDLGLIAKSGDDGTFLVFVTDLLTTKPISGATVNLYDYQQKIIGTVKTDGEGKAEIKPAGRPFVMMAQKEKQTGYLKLIEGGSLSLSMFDVSGQPIQKGLKGFIYGERGIWRPGDSLYLTFILEDKLHQLPENHPVTFSLVNPNGQMVTRIVKNSAMSGFYSFKTFTDRNAPTGNWLAKVKVGGVDFQKTIKIETVKPNRLKINLNFGTDRLMADHMPQASLLSNWLTGATARNLKYAVNLTLSKASASFKKYPDFVFDNPSSTFSPEKIVVANGKLDAGGKALFPLNIHLTNRSPCILNADFETTVFEEGGDFSVDRFTIPYYAYHSYVGLFTPKNKYNDHILYTNQVNKIGLINLDVNGNLIASNHLKVEVYKLDWRWWWDDSETRSGAGFVSTTYLRPVDSASVTTVNGRAEYAFDVSDDDWGRYFIRVTDLKSGHVAGKVVYTDWYGYNRMPGGDKQAASMLNFTADKEKYNVGDKVTLTFPSADGGRALLNIETGSKVLKSFWIPTKKGSTQFSFEVDEEMAPNCYAYITLLQPHAQTLNDLPIRLYGVIPVMVEDPKTHLKPQIIMKDVLVPDQNASITVKEEKGKEMTYTLAVVDEGLLDLTRFKTPDAWSVFYAREALGVKTWDLFDLVMGAYSGELQRILSIGGDQEGKLNGNLKANRFKPMVCFFGPFELKKGQSKTFTFKMPRYIGSVRVMIVAGNHGSYGSSEKTVPVKSPLMVLGTLPRVAGPGETLKLPVTVFAMEKSIHEVNIEVIPDKMFSVVGNSTGKLSFDQTGDKMITFDLKAKESIGVGKVRIVASCGKEKAVSDIEMDIRNPNPRVTNIVDAVIPPGKTWNSSYVLPGMTGTNKGVIELSAIPPLNLEKRINDLVTYPYGCIEQTVSAAFPQLYLADLMDLSAATKSETEMIIKFAIHHVRDFQLSNGGIGYWPGNQYADDWASNYAGHFILEAEQKGYAMPVGFLQPWKEYQKQKAISWAFNSTYYNDELMQAYRLYTLALAKSPELGAMNKLLEQKDLSLPARWRLAAAYQLAGKSEIAAKLIGNASVKIKPYRELYYTYGSDIRDKAMIVEALCLMNMKIKAAELVKEISVRLASNEWMSTQEAAYALLAISKFTGMTSGNGIYVNWRGIESQSVDVKLDKSVYQEKMMLSGSAGKMQVVNKGKNLVYVRLILQGIPAKGDSTSTQNDLKMSVVYRSMAGPPIDPRKLEQGTNFIAEVTVTNPGLRGEYQQLALTQIFPSGWEIVNTRLSEFAKTATENSLFNYQDFRDDRVNTFFDIAPNKTKTFMIMLTASYLGRFYLPSAYCEAMYDNSINARVAGKWVEVVASGKE